MPLDGETDRKRRDFDDLQNEISGRVTGRRARFMPGSDSNDPEGEKRKAEEQRFRDLLDLYLQDPEYRALYIELGDKLRDAEIGADAAIAALQAQLDALDEMIADLEDRAARGPNGELVFRTADGRVVNADGEELPPEIAEGIIWPDNAPSAEQYFAAMQKRDAVSDQLTEWHDYRRDVLGDIRNRYDDRENPMEKNDMEDALDAIEAARPASHSVSIQHEASDIVPVAGASAFPQIPGNNQ